MTNLEIYDPKLRKAIDDAYMIKKGCIKMVQNATNFWQLINSSKGVISVNKLINILEIGCKEKSTSSSDDCLNCQSISLMFNNMEWATLWTDEAKKKGINGYCFILICTDTQVIESEIVEFNTTYTSISIPNIIISNLRLESRIEMISYLYFIDQCNYKKFTKIRDKDSSEILPFVMSGQTVFTIRELTKLKSPVLSITLKLDGSNNTSFSCNYLAINYNKNPEYEIKNSLDRSSSSSNDTKRHSLSFSRTKFVHWPYIGTNIYLIIRELESPFSRFCTKALIISTEIDFNQLGTYEIYFIQFKGPNLEFYQGLETYMLTIIASLNILQSEIDHVLKSDTKIIIHEPNNDKNIELDFGDKEIKLKFIDYLNLYKKYLNLWGPNIRIYQNSKSSLDVMKLIISSFYSNINLLDKKPMIPITIDDI